MSDENLTEIYETNQFSNPLKGLNKFIVKNILGIKDFNNNEIKNIYNSFNSEKNNFNWENLANNEYINKKNNIEQLKDYIRFMIYLRGINRTDLIKNFKIKLLDSYFITGTDDILHILTSAILSSKYWDELIFFIGQKKEIIFDNPRKQKKISSNLEKSEEEIIRNRIIEDSIHDMKSNIIGIMLGNFLEEFPNKNIYDFFENFGKDKNLQDKFKELQKEYGLTKEQLLIK